MKIGIDLVKITDLQKTIYGDLEKIFTIDELSSTPKELAGIFAAKEAFFKALGRKEDWLSVWLEHEDSGKPLLKTILPLDNKKTEVSISYAGEYATAIVIIF
ncbi:hypothetical protein A3A05_02240 [Candidatus Nomurabacteria bacterium RIFCSPLOWO2_01_FULL_41_12]|uniref:4'-phosphopantetheinyl transferase domain-containing protein n=1 Tax=Candidatus Nomurabacteria bacterium RIFCSPLOWO2_01_FULL_41_12 TaxID=1801774 RepID=A0A1F6WUH4_9BACT|nr:MAG: hypothetical protein A2732_02160 [Candidatus Nomurabacteria bacterium RIFCSPHIGHO2_01_FULL_40_10]OGI85532.1 MAG: hypothetical protein A3A05_02240 [Candidatus Nomurabacteria bacterium RIFCSPLOWO2_01_FULL_41_12]